MSNPLRFAIALLAGVVALRAAEIRAASNEAPRTRSTAEIDARSENNPIQKLIDQLGNEQYFLRRQAEEKLIERGAEAFDLLLQAEEHPDLEIATRAHYILQQVRIEWTDPADSAEVQLIMHRYGELSKAERIEKMEQLSSLGDDNGLGALCRIARFEPTPRLARYAALKVMQAKSPPDRAAKDVQVISRDLGDSRRTPVQWLLTYAEQLGQPDRVLDRWLDLIDAETALLAEDSPDTEAAFVFRLAAFHLELCRRNSQSEAIFANLMRRTALYLQQKDHARKYLAVILQGTGQERREFLGPAYYAVWLLEDRHAEDFGLAYALNWLLENQQWEALELFEDHYAEEIRDQRLLVYLSAAARWRQGRDELAEEFAERAFQLESDDANERVEIADLMGELGRHDWAEREWQHTVETFPVLDVNSLSARRSLASLRLHDRGEDKRAAALMAEVCDAVETDAKLKNNIMRDAVRRSWLNQFLTQKEYFLACEAAAEGKYDQQRTHLDAAYGLDPLDADVLIAMYRSPGADEAYRKTTVSRIQGAANKVANRIQQQPDDAQWYNHWAWLVSNTEGDYNQAVKYSLRSLELIPDSPSYLDTLGRCYYAVGDLENAVQVQREAVRRHPHLQVMRDQLKLFESALAQREKKDKYGTQTENK